MTFSAAYGFCSRREFAQHPRPFVQISDGFKKTSAPARNRLSKGNSELHAHLKRDHARCAVAAQTDAEQSGRRRCGVRDRSKSALRGRFSWNAGQHHAGKRKIRMVEYIEELRVEPQFHTFRHGKPL
jgi:hypothetical protein